jgi:tRNA U34 5-methylaminomethyl-2-thiouridine-forming methyltransferase MnmC
VGCTARNRAKDLTSNVAETPTGCEKHSLDSARDFCKLVCGVALGEGSQHATQFAVWFV